jgi:hypothetical protein
MIYCARQYQVEFSFRLEKWRCHSNVVEQIEGTRALQRHRLAVDVIRFAIAPSLSISMCRILRGVATVSVDLKPPGLARRN